MTSLAPNAFLKRALLADAAVSGAVALLQLVASKPVAAYTGLSATLLLGTGVFLLGYVALLIALATRDRVWSSLIWLVIAGNLAWAVAALSLVAALPLAPLGQGFALVHAVTVTAFGYLEYRGLSGSGSEQSAPQARSRVRPACPPASAACRVARGLASFAHGQKNSARGQDGAASTF